MSDIVEFVLARIGEREAAARRANERGVATYLDVRQIKSPRGEYMLHPPMSGSPQWDAWVEHSEHWPPARVLADCEAKRRIVALHRPYHVKTSGDRLNWDYSRCAVCDSADLAPGEGNWPCQTVRLLASVDADHPEFDSEWRA